MSYSIFNKDATINYNNIDLSTLNLYEDSEIEIVRNSIIDCLNYMIKNNKFKISSDFNDGIIVRAASNQDIPRDHNYTPVPKEISKHCKNKSTKPDPNEAIWFSTHFISTYFTSKIKDESEIGIKFCRKIKIINSETNYLMTFIDLNSHVTQQTPCKDKPRTTFLLDTTLQEHFNNCLLIPLVRTFSSEHNNDSSLTNEFILDNRKYIILDKHVNGYPCNGEEDSDKNTKIATVKTLLETWNYETGKRYSRFNEDRLQITILFKIFNIFNEILKSNGSNIINKDIVKFANPSGVTILGWTSKDMPQMIENKATCTFFPSEITMPIKFFDAKYRYGIFSQTDDECNVSQWQKKTEY